MPTRNLASGGERPNLEGIARTHPIVPIVLAKNNPKTNAILPEFLENQLLGSEKQIPYLLHSFYGNYLEYVIQRHLRRHRAQYGPKHYRWNIRDAIDRLSKLAFISYVRGTKISEAMVLRQMEGIGLEKEVGDIRDIEFRSMGLLVQDGVTGKRGKVTYRFGEQIVTEYLVANYHLLQCLKATTASQTHKLVTGVLTESMSKLPMTGDIWRITFGLLNADQHTRAVQPQILEEIIDVSKRTDGMTSFDVTSLSVEAIYESQNAGELAGQLDAFSLNQTVNYSNVFMSKSRLAYTVSAVGYLVRASPDVYGLHLARLTLGEEKISLLADPVNAVSDNNLQVLNLSGNPLGPSGMRRLQRFIVKASLLTHLDLSECELDNVSVSMLSEFFMCLPLRYLNLDSNRICDAGLLHMLSNLKYVPTLEVLNIADNQLTDRSIVPLGQKIASALPNLRSVDLNRNMIGEKGLLAMSKALPGLAHIEEVRIAENAGGSLRATEVITHTWKSKSLKHININMNQIPPEGVLALTKVRLSHEDAIPLADEDPEDDDPDMSVDHDDTFDSVAVLGQSHDFSMHSTRLGDSQDVRLMMQDTWDKSQSMDLLAGRPDKVRAVPLRRSTSRAGSLPRMKDVRRSWHGMSAGLRESFRSTKDSLYSRGSLRGSEFTGSQMTANVSQLGEGDQSVRESVVPEVSQPGTPAPSERTHDTEGSIQFIDEDEMTDPVNTTANTPATGNDNTSASIPNGHSGRSPDNKSLNKSSTSPHNLRDSLRRSHNNIKDSLKVTGTSIRDSFRKRFARRSPTRTKGTSIETTV